MKRPARRVAIGVAAGVFVALAAATGVSANWQAQQSLPGGVVTSGDLNISTTWVGGTAWPSIAPTSTISKQAVVTVTGNGTTLEAVLTGVAAYQNTAFTGYVTSSIHLGECASAGSALPSSGYPSTGSLSLGSAVTLCVRYTLSANAPASLQGQDLSPSVTFTASQRGAL